MTHEDFMKVREAVFCKVADKVNDIFLEIQEANGITDGYIDPMDDIRLEEAQDTLSEAIFKVIETQLNRR